MQRWFLSQTLEAIEDQVESELELVGVVVAGFRDVFDHRLGEVGVLVDGNSSLSRLRHALTPKGTLVIAGGETDGRLLGGADRQLRALMLSPFVGQKLGTFISKENHEDMIVLKDFIEAGSVTPVIDRTYALSDVPDAIRYLDEGHARGKVAITI